MRRSRDVVVRSLLTVLLTVAAAVLAGCGSQEAGAGAAPFRLPVGSSEWEASAPAWLADGTLHVGDRTVPLPGAVDSFVVAPTGAYWLRGSTLRFTDVAGTTRRVRDLERSEIAISADRSTLAVVDASRGPTDSYGTHVAQVAVFDTRTGQQRYRTPDEEPDDGADLADLYEETTPLLQGVSDTTVFFDRASIDIATGARAEVTQDSDGVDSFPGADTALFRDGFHVGVRSEGERRRPGASTLDGVGALSPDRRWLFDLTTSSPPPIVYDARTGRPQPLELDADSFALVGWIDDRTFWGIGGTTGADEEFGGEEVTVSQQVLRCTVEQWRCVAASPQIPVPSTSDADAPVSLLVEGALPL
ncbi:hypothetical protein [Nocardioides sp.]|uniref:hypothetical protein n=1 Tax=Nocardioides sp. TaxID=35761 RepID=UPI00351729BF